MVVGSAEGGSPRGPLWKALLGSPWFAPAIAFLLALAARVPLYKMPIYGDEAVLYYLSRYPLQDPPNAFSLDLSEPMHLGHFFWWRPLFRLLLAPGAMVSFDAYRVLHLVIAALLPSLAILLLRRNGVRPSIAYATGAATALFPMLVHWGVVVFPDTTMVVAFTAGLLAREHRRPVLAMIGFTCAIWLKEVAVIGVIFVFGWDLWDGWRRGRESLRPLRLTVWSWGYPIAIGAGLLPLFYYMSLGGAQPGWTPGGNGPELVDFFFPALWLAVLPIVGLWWNRSRFYCALSLVYPGFYLTYAWGLDRGVELWYMVQPVFLGMLACAVVVEQLARIQTPRASAARRALPMMAAALVLTAVGVQTLVPMTWGPKAELTMPMGRLAQASLAEVYERDYGFDPLADLQANMAAEDWTTVFVVDFGWFFIPYPMADQAETLRYGYTGWQFAAVSEIERWTKIIEETANVTIVHTPATVNPLNEALRIAYADCRDFQNVDYDMIHGRDCPGRSERVVQEYERLTGRELS